MKIKFMYIMLMENNIAILSLKAKITKINLLKIKINIFLYYLCYRKKQHRNETYYISKSYSK